jgi:hypothetical protein
VHAPTNQPGGVKTVGNRLDLLEQFLGVYFVHSLTILFRGISPLKHGSCATIIQIAVRHVVLSLDLTQGLLFVRFCLFENAHRFGQVDSIAFFVLLHEVFCVLENYLMIKLPVVLVARKSVEEKLANAHHLLLADIVDLGVFCDVVLHSF